MFRSSKFFAENSGLNDDRIPSDVPLIVRPVDIQRSRIASESGQWVGNGLRFATKEEAETYLAELDSGRNTRVVESSDPVNYRWENGRIVRPD
jgi:hypothetical protein